MSGAQKQTAWGYFEQRIRFAVEVGLWTEFDYDGEVKLERDSVEEVPQTWKGEIRLPCMALSPVIRKSPQEIVARLAPQLAWPELYRIEIVKGYINFFFDRPLFLSTLVKEVLYNNSIML